LTENETDNRVADHTAQQPSNPTILVVDDNKAVLEFLLLLLSKHGLSVIGASNGRECLDIVRSRPVDLIVLDVMMPVLDGLQVCHELKKIIPALPVILLTARDDMTTRAAAMDLGVSEFVAKPVNNRDLLSRVRMQLSSLESAKSADQIFFENREIHGARFKKKHNHSG
jgi:DNA-binding response OmpR family regulator